MELDTILDYCKPVIPDLCILFIFHFFTFKIKILSTLLLNIFVLSPYLNELLELGEHNVILKLNFILIFVLIFYIDSTKYPTILCLHLFIMFITKYYKSYLFICTFISDKMHILVHHFVALQIKMNEFLSFHLEELNLKLKEKRY